MHQLGLLLCNEHFKKHVWKVEVADCIKDFNADDFAPNLLKLQALPRNRSTILLSDCLGWIESDEKDYVTVKEFAMMAGLGDFLCVDIGRFSVSGKFEQTQTNGPQQAGEDVPEVVNTPEQYNVLDDMLSLIEPSSLQLSLVDVTR
jgi:hypothetical protein